ncbi:MAG TPA: N-acetyl-gamma-glutamyl-phosphate reductase [Sphingomicrobium sp.]|nr:N-acetyl-gamma-glutamyl-phosphate reductase [Sphingomicrobium sp.]
MIRTAILGASGYVGGELLRLSAGHPQLQPTKLFGDSKAGKTVEEVHPHLAAAYPKLAISTFAEDELDDVDLAFAALPHGHSLKIAAKILERNIPFVDLGADFRLASADEYERWYGEKHQAPELLGHFAYGIPEFHREAIRGAKAVAAAGCYPTAAILALKPLIDAGLIKPGTIIVDAASGVSGAGRSATEATSFNSVDGSFSAYGLMTHRHTAEMEQELGSQVLFTPHLAPMARGILATCYAQASGSMSADRPLEALRSAYANEPFVHVTEQSPATKWTTGSNAVHVTARYDPRTERVFAIAALDNLLKGAAGQMIQCANLMLGIEEANGLPICGIFP